MGTDGVTKMSKSRGNAILMTAEPEELIRVVTTMVTDIERPRRTDPGHPERCNVCQLHRIFSPDRYTEIWEGERSARTGCMDTKRALAEAMARYFAPMRERRRELEARPGAVWEILEAGAARARVSARETIAAVRDAMGLGAPG